MTSVLRFLCAELREAEISNERETGELAFDTKNKLAQLIDNPLRHTPWSNERE